ncbi:MAG: ATP-binding protein [bacterium]
MKQIVIISGKGGTGKTVLSASFAVLARNAVFADCDVDAADLHLLLRSEIKETHDFQSGKKAKIDKKLCTECGYCIDVCRFASISSDFIVDAISCEGCGVCSYICPARAIEMEDNVSGEWFISETKYGPLVHARLGIAETNSGKLVSLVRQNAKKIAKERDLKYIIIDGPPGISCPVIASLVGVDLAIIVTEPSLSGIHDMKRIIELAKNLSIPIQVIINKADINTKNSIAIEKLCKMSNIPVLGRLPFSDKVVESITKGVPVVEFCKEEITEEINIIWEKIAS